MLDNVQLDNCACWTIRKSQKGKSGLSNWIVQLDPTLYFPSEISFTSVQGLNFKLWNIFLTSVDTKATTNTDTANNQRDWLFYPCKAKVFGFANWSRLNFHNCCFHLGENHRRRTFLLDFTADLVAWLEERGCYKTFQEIRCFYTRILNLYLKKKHMLTTEEYPALAMVLAQNCLYVFMEFLHATLCKA